MRTHVSRAIQNPRGRTQSATASRTSEKSRNRADEPNPMGTESTASDALEARSGRADGWDSELSARTNPNRTSGVNCLSEMLCGRQTAKPPGANEANRGRLAWSTRPWSGATPLRRRSRNGTNEANRDEAAAVLGFGANEANLRHRFDHPRPTLGRLTQEDVDRRKTSPPPRLAGVFGCEYVGSRFSVS